MLRLEVLHPNLFTFSRDGPLPLMWKNLTTRSKSLQPSEVEALTDRTALIAGGPSGCGLQLAKILAMPCSHLIITAPNSQRDQQIVEEHLKGLPNDTIRNLISMCGHSRWSPSVLNAGVWHLWFARLEGSFETHLQVNYLASCALSLTLLTVLGRGRSPNSRPGRLLNVTSEGHSLEDIPTGKTAQNVLENLNDPNALSCYQRYGKSKLLSMIWPHELASSIDSASSEVEIASFNPI
ncbi:hypothetical protein MFRU_039g00400 [Monilinia fructicola]|nr:hypothetical protein MFRU_039g00400 [Monilinia fructicola]